MIGNDEEILALIDKRKTRDKGFRLLVSQTKERLYWQIRRMVVSHEDTNDLLQDVYVKVFRNISSFKRDSALSTWIYRIAFNKTINFLHSKAKRNKDSSVTIEEEMVQNLKNDKYFNYSALNLALEKAILTLPDKQRTVFLLRYYDDMPFKQMAEVLNTNEGALKTSYHIAEKKIREILLQSGLNF